MPKLEIRRAVEDDAPAVSECIEAAYSKYAARIKDLPAVSEGIAHEIAEHLVFILEHGHSIVGTVVIICKEEYALLANIAVDPEYAGKGFGRRLMVKAESECRGLGLPEMRLTTHVDMPENIQFYKGLGWRETGRTGSKVHMAKLLPEP